MQDPPEEGVKATDPRAEQPIKQASKKDKTVHNLHLGRTPAARTSSAFQLFEMILKLVKDHKELLDPFSSIRAEAWKEVYGGLAKDHCQKRCKGGECYDSNMVGQTCASHVKEFTLLENIEVEEAEYTGPSFNARPSSTIGKESSGTSTTHRGGSLYFKVILRATWTCVCYCEGGTPYQSLLLDPPKEPVVFPVNPPTEKEKAAFGEWKKECEKARKKPLSEYTMEPYDPFNTNPPWKK